MPRAAETPARDPAPEAYPFHRILVAVDDTPPALEALRQATALARLSNARLDVLTAVPYPTTVYWAGAVQPMELGEKIAAESLREAAALVEDVPVTTYLVRGAAARAILDHAEQHGCDLIVMGGRRRGRATAALFGSVSHAVLHGADVPVLVVSASHEEPDASDDDVEP